MELRSISLGARRRTSSALSDPLYDNCLSHAESTNPGVTRALQTPPPPQAPQAPSVPSAAAHPPSVPTLFLRGDCGGSGRGQGGCGPIGPGSSAWSMGRKEEGWPPAAGTPSRDHDLHYYHQHHYYRQSPHHHHHHHHQQHPHQQQDAVSCCSSTHESIVSLYDNLEQPRQRSPIDDDSQDLDLDLDLDPDNADFESEWLLEHDWRDCLERSRTEDKLTYACGSREDRRPSQGTQSAKPQKRSSDNPDDNPFLFSAAESRPKVQKTPRPLSESSILETVIADVPEEVLLQQGSTMDLHTTSLQLKLSYPPSSPANSLPTSGSPPAVPQRTDNSTMTVLLGNIKQQIVQQKEEYETQIHRLEQRNEALEVEVLGLRANLEQQRRWYRAVEQRLCEVERARADADRRNAELQSQMEQFFDAFGELTNEAKKTERIVQGFE